jgi:hypothetical protein
MTLNHHETSDRIQRVRIFVSSISNILSEYSGVSAPIEIGDFVTTFTEERLETLCPDACGLSAALLTWVSDDEHLVAIHVSEQLVNKISSFSDLSRMLLDQGGMDGFFILVEEVSHLHQYILALSRNAGISRFALELQAELDKVVVAVVAFQNCFGFYKTQDLLDFLYRQSVIVSQLTDYSRVSRMAEQFWRQSLEVYGPTFLNNRNFR